MGFASSIGEQMDTLREQGTEAFDVDNEQFGNALLNTGHPEDPLEDPNRDVDAVRDPVAAVRYQPIQSGWKVLATVGVVLVGVLVLLGGD